MSLVTDKTIYPVYLFEEGTELPKEGTYYVIAGNGCFMRKDTGLVRCFVPVPSISMLDDLNTSTAVECTLPMIPARHVWRIKQFFKRVVEKYRSEAEVNLYFNKDTNDFKIHVPEQYVSHAGVDYRRAALTHAAGMEKYLRVGTIHSHCDFGAFHSSTDLNDENDFDGLHVTFGHNDKDEFSVSASIAVNGHRMQVDPMTVLDGIRAVRIGYSAEHLYALTDSDDCAEIQKWTEGLDEWMEQVHPSFARSFFRKENEGIGTGDRIVWAGDLSTCQLRSVMGDGPFDVLAVEDGKVVIKTNVGLARFSNKLFRRA